MPAADAVPDSTGGAAAPAREPRPAFERPLPARPAHEPLVARLVQQQAARQQRESAPRHAAPAADHAGEPPAHREPGGLDGRPSCTGPQLRRFIKSRAYIPMHELRRRFGIVGGDDDVSAVDVGNGRIFVGLPGPEGQMLGELLRSGDIGYELSTDPMTPVVIGVYAMRPVTRG